MDHFSFCMFHIPAVEPILKLSGILPFGVTAGDTFGPTGDDSSSKAFNLAVPFNFLGKEYQSITVRPQFTTHHITCIGPSLIL